MIRPGQQPLDSLRLMQHADQVACYLCGGFNTYEAERCHDCLAPMALAHQAASQKILPKMIAALGGSSAGKTVYLGLLMDMLSRQSGSLQVLARGAFSINLQQAAVGALARGEFPDPTPRDADRWNWVHCQLRSQAQKTPLELIVPDLAGESLLQELDHPHAYPVIHPLLSKSLAGLIFVDALKLQNGSLDEDYFTMKLLSYLSEIHDEAPRDRRKHGWAQRPIAFVLTKADECERCFDDPAGFAESHAPGFWRHCRERFGNHRFFAAGVAGACAYRITRAGRQRVPLRVEPRGIIEPFEWLVKQLKN